VIVWLCVVMWRSEVYRLKVGCDEVQVRFLRRLPDLAMHNNIILIHNYLEKL
jgi:hypothetical protein